jgi:hypothetical protein
MSKHRFHGAVCAFDFYVTSLDTTQQFNAYEKMSDSLTLVNALEEFKRRDTYTPSTVVLSVGVEYRITNPEYRNSVNLGACDLLQRVDGEYRIPDDWKSDKVLLNEALISGNSMKMIQSFVEEHSQKERAEKKPSKSSVEYGD